MLPVRNPGRMMTAAKRPEDPISLVRAEMDQLFNRFLGNFPPVPEELYGQLGGELKETEAEIVVRLDAPGFEPADFVVQVSGEVLMVGAEAKVEANGAVVRRMERTITLPVPVLAEKVEAMYRHGVLELKLPKAEVAKWMKVPVKAG